MVLIVNSTWLKSLKGDALLDKDVVFVATLSIMLIKTDIVHVFLRQVQAEVAAERFVLGLHR